MRVLIALLAASLLCAPGSIPPMGRSGLPGATQDWIVVWQDEAATYPAGLERALRGQGLAASENLFTPREQRYLIELGMADVAASRVVKVAGEAGAERLRHAFLQAGLRVKLEPRAVKLKRATVDSDTAGASGEEGEAPLPPIDSRGPDPFAIHQWAYQNRSRMQSVELDHDVTRWVPAVAGEDLRLTDMPDLPGRESIIVAELDTGVDVKHPDLAPVIVRKESECRALEKYQACKKAATALTDPAEARAASQACETTWFDLKNPEVDQDRNGYPMDCTGWSTLGQGKNPADIVGRPDFEDTEGHGTHVAGILGSVQNNGIGVRGASPHVRILPVQVLGANPNEPIKPLAIGAPPPPPGMGPGPDDDSAELPQAVEKGRRRPTGLADFVARGMIYAIRSGAQVINFSMGWPPAVDSELMRKMVAKAQKRGVVVVAAAGNDATEALLNPCGYPGVICVGAHGPDGALSHFSNYGSGVDIAAPGLNILSTWPMNIRGIRFKPASGYDYLHGTSQASPFVAGIVAEMLYRGMSPDEAHARLILGARPHQRPLEFVAGGYQELYEAVADSSKLTPKLRQGDEGKFTLSGNLDFAAALRVKPQAVLLPYDKEKILIPWDRRSAELSLRFRLKNYWQPAARVVVSGSIAKPDPRLIRPEVVSIEPAPEAATGPWAAGEVREYIARIRITDAAPEASRIPSDLTVDVQASIVGGVTRRFQVRGEVISQVGRQFLPAGAYHLPFANLPKEARYSYYAIKDVLDGRPEFLDYVAISYGEKEWTFVLLAQDRAANPTSAPYAVRGQFKLPVPFDVRYARFQIMSRVDVDGDGQSEYVLGLVEDRSNLTKPEPSPITFLTADASFKLIRRVKLNSKSVRVPNQVTGIQVQWMKDKTQKVPAWMGGGMDPARTVTTLDQFLDPYDTSERPDLRFYYLAGGTQLTALSKYETAGKTYRIADVLRPTTQQQLAGRVPVLLARDTGTERKSSYIYEFARAEIYEGKVENFTPLSLFEHGLPYRDLLNTRADSVFSLYPGMEQHNGTFWFGAGKPHEQRLSMLIDPGSKFADYGLAAMRGTVDATLWVRAAYSGPEGNAAFTLTNSEIQFHDLKRNQTARMSLERYTFYDDRDTSNNLFPLVVGSRSGSGSHSGGKLPSLYTLETSMFSRGMRALVPIYAEDGSLLELAAPASLRYIADDCIPMMDPVQTTTGAHSFDYLCEDHLVRIPLVY